MYAAVFAKSVCDFGRHLCVYGNMVAFLAKYIFVSTFTNNQQPVTVTRREINARLLKATLPIVVGRRFPSKKQSAVVGFPKHKAERIALHKQFTITLKNNML